MQVGNSLSEHFSPMAVKLNGNLWKYWKLRGFFEFGFLIGSGTALGGIKWNWWNYGLFDGIQ